MTGWRRKRRRRRAGTTTAPTLPGIDGATSAPTPTSRATSRRKGTTQTPSPMPWLAVVLAVDTAAWSGWSIRVAGVQREFGEADTLDAASLLEIVRWALRCAGQADMPLVLVLEAPWGGPVSMLVSLGAARERWLHAWRELEQPARHVVRVNPSTWRGPVLGRHFVSAPREEIRDQEQLVAGAMVGCACDPDEAAAILIGRWAAHSAEVGRAIGKRAAADSLRAWTTRRTE